MGEYFTQTVRFNNVQNVVSEYLHRLLDLIMLSLMKVVGEYFTQTVRFNIVQKAMAEYFTQTVRFNNVQLNEGDR